MARRYFVSDDTKRIDLTEGDWIEVKNGLSYGEGLRLASASVDEIRQKEDGSSATKFDLTKFRVERMMLYIVNWTAKSRSGGPAKVNRETIEDLDPEFADEIDAALDKHVAELNEAKNSKTAES